MIERRGGKPPSEGTHRLARLQSHHLVHVRMAREQRSVGALGHKRDAGVGMPQTDGPEQRLVSTTSPSDPKRTARTRGLVVIAWQCTGPPGSAARWCVIGVPPSVTYSRYRH